VVLFADARTREMPSKDPSVSHFMSQPNPTQTDLPWLRPTEKPRIYWGSRRFQQLITRRSQVRILPPL
jgi:hypothetical protein